MEDLYIYKIGREVKKLGEDKKVQDQYMSSIKEFVQGRKKRESKFMAQKN